MIRAYVLNQLTYVNTSAKNDAIREQTLIEGIPNDIKIRFEDISLSPNQRFVRAEFLKMNSPNTATVSCENAVLRAYGIVPMENFFPSSVHLKKNQSSVRIDHFALLRCEEITKCKIAEETLSADDIEIPLTMEQPSLNCQKERLNVTKKHVLEAYGISF